MKRLRVPLAVVAFAAAAAGLTGTAPPAMAQGAAPAACPATGCKIPGITVPNGLVICKDAGGANVHDVGKIDPKKELCNTGPINPETWVYGPRHDLTPAQDAAPLYSQVAQRIAQGLPFAGTRWGAADGSDYCNVAKYVPGKNDFTWADEAHAPLDASVIYPKWQKNCPGLTYETTAARGSLGSWVDEREAQHDSDGGAILMIRPVDSVRDAQQAVFWNYWPPFGHRSQGGSNVYDDVIKATGNAPYRDSYNKNLVMIAQITTVDGAKAANGIAALEGIQALFLDEDNLRLQATGVANYDQLAQGVKDAAKANHKYLCTVDPKARPVVMTCNP